MKNYASCTDEALALLYIDGDNKAFDELLARNQASTPILVSLLSG